MPLGQTADAKRIEVAAKSPDELKEILREALNPIKAIDETAAKPRDKWCTITDCHGSV